MSNPIIDEAGSMFWYDEDGMFHRENGPACVYGSGTKSWWIHGERHRTDGPAVEGFDGYKCWWVRDKRHRIDGPARIWPNGDKRWYLDDVEYSEEEYNEKVKEYGTIN